MYKNVPWVDKYRPKKLYDIIYQTDVTDNLKDIVNSGKMPHLILYGPSGTGKTSAILALATELFGPKKVKERVIELNASDERGINVVRHKIINFVKSVIGNADGNYLCPNYKIIILDEADAMTIEAQSALRKMIETYSNITRFCFICNYINQLIEPIISRCVKYKFAPLDNQSIIVRLNYISIQEKFDVDVNFINKIASISNGDMRKSIMMLQYLKYMLNSCKNNNNLLDYNNNSEKKNTEIVENIIEEISTMIPDLYIQNIINICVSDKSTSIDNIIKLVDNIQYDGYAAYMLIKQIGDDISRNILLTDKQKGLICIQISQIDKMLINGAHEYIQLLQLFLYIKCVTMSFINDVTIYQYL